MIPEKILTIMIRLHTGKSFCIYSVALILNYKSEIGLILRSNRVNSLVELVTENACESDEGLFRRYFRLHQIGRNIPTSRAF